MDMRYSVILMHDNEFNKFFLGMMLIEAMAITNNIYLPVHIVHIYKQFPRCEFDRLKHINVLKG